MILFLLSPDCRYRSCDASLIAFAQGVATGFHADPEILGTIDRGLDSRSATGVRVGGQQSEI